MTTTVHFDDLASLIGQPLGATEWMTISQDRINTFADATGDPQWIHVDPERAKTGPFGTTIAHGYLTLSLIVPLFVDLLDVEGVTTKLNYGLNKVRFMAPVRVNRRVRPRFTLQKVEDIAGGLQLTFTITVEIEGEDKPACVAESIVRRMFNP